MDVCKFDSCDDYRENEDNHCRVYKYIYRCANWRARRFDDITERRI